nr:hypothetical protein [Mycoplasmopsis bovis]
MPFYIITATIIPIEEQIIERKIIPRIIKLKLMVAINTQGFKGKTDILLYITVSFITLKDIESETIRITGQAEETMPGIKSLTLNVRIALKYKS